MCVLSLFSLSLSLCVVCCLCDKKSKLKNLGPPPRPAREGRHTRARVNPARGARRKRRGRPAEEKRKEKKKEKKKNQAALSSSQTVLPDLRCQLRASLAQLFFCESSFSFLPSNDGCAAPGWGPSCAIRILQGAWHETFAASVGVMVALTTIAAIRRALSQRGGGKLQRRPGARRLKEMERRHKGIRNLYSNLSTELSTHGIPWSDTEQFALETLLHELGTPHTDEEWESLCRP